MKDRSRLPRRRHIRKTLNNLKITVLCGVITVLVLRGTVDFGNLLGAVGGVSGDVDEDHKVVEDIDRVLREIRSNHEPDDEDDSNVGVDFSFAPLNYTSAADAVAALSAFASKFTLGPKISDWDDQRRRWLDQNPGFPSWRPDGKPRILLVTGSTPNPCENPMCDHYLLKGTKNKIDYCRLHGIEIVYNTAHLDREFAGDWAKLPLIRRLMLSHPEVEWFWWMDSDALFTDMAFEIPLRRYAAHNLVVPGQPDLIFKERSWIGLSTGSFLLRNCQWSLELLDAWAPMGPKGRIRDEAGKMLTANLKDRPAFEADDQSALIYLLLRQQERWGGKVYIENSYRLHGYWVGLVDRYEEMMEKHHTGSGNGRWPFVTHFVGCKPCGSQGDYPVERCFNSMERAFNFADNQVLRMYGFSHENLTSAMISRTEEQTSTPLEFLERLNLVAGTGSRG
ncbi:probable glycosyltransferase 2 [Zingiber officinale]|uniref:Uncharacterized protein n=1 Tax=Zingiber officinale TaxID=94328 RepID=A0A8J5FX34_ZINOF|nr:probable glycosyltransferase 2 [Zingiber officinale]KAG6496515.1 hypothetical protein ZIOFF_044382 [Zingiber officinale]